MGIRSQIRKRGKIGFNLFLIYLHPFPPLLPQFFMCLSSTPQTKEILRYKKYWGVFPPHPSYANDICHCLSKELIVTHVLVSVLASFSVSALPIQVMFVLCAIPFCIGFVIVVCTSCIFVYCIQCVLLHSICCGLLIALVSILSSLRDILPIFCYFVCVSLNSCVGIDSFMLCFREKEI